MGDWTHIVTCREVEKAYCKGYEIKARVDETGTFRCAERELKNIDFGKTLTGVCILKTRRV